MAEQDKQGQNRPADTEAGATDEKAAPAASSGTQSGRLAQADSDSTASSPEQTGEGTGAKAGEYS